MGEAWFGIFRRKSVRRGSFDTVRALIRYIDAYIANWNTHPTPFVWTKDSAAIVKKALGRGRSDDFRDGTLGHASALRREINFSLPDGVRNFTTSGP